MFLSYENKKSENDILQNTPRAELQSVYGQGAASKLIQGNNLPILRSLLDTYQGKVALVYIDPPFATNGAFRIGSDRVSTVSSSKRDRLAYSDTLLGAAYLEFLRERLIFLRELLSDEGSIYLHIDTKMGHYVKILMDEVFGARNFRNDISRIKCNPKNFHRRAYGNIKDLILFYSKTGRPIWNDPRQPYSEEDGERLFRKIDESGRRYTTIPLHAPGETRNGSTGQVWRGIEPPKGRHWRSNPQVLEAWNQQGLIEWSANGVPRKKKYMDESQGKKVQDIWEFKDPQHPLYPTQKNLDLLKRIIAASSNKGDWVLDCFCGSGTALLASQALGRCWIGIDESEPAIETAQERLGMMHDGLPPPPQHEFLRGFSQELPNCACDDSQRSECCELLDEPPVSA